MTTRKDLLCRILFRSVAEGFLNYITTRRDSRGSGEQGDAGTQNQYDSAHNTAIQSENKVNGNTRQEATIQNRPEFLQKKMEPQHANW